MKRFLFLYVLPTMVLIAVSVFPLITGARTLYLRDVLNAHFEMKSAEAQALRAGYVPLIDAYRGGGQPLAGNPNSVPFYPDNILYLLASALWALNAHFWLHLLIAPWAMFWLAREWGLERTAAWTAGVIYAVSGFFLSNLNFYNLIAGVALAPALIAATLASARRPAGWRLAAVGGLWALMLLAGDPFTAALALLLALVAMLFDRGWSRRLLRPAVMIAASLAAGTLVASSQLIEMWRILPLSFRGYWGYSPTATTVASWDPRQAAGWLLPFLFGRPDRLATASFWGRRFFTGNPPYYFSLYPGLLVLGLVAASGLPRGRERIWAWSIAGGGVFFALGRFNPLLGWFWDAGIGRSFRYPVKFWLPVAIGGTLLAAIGFERAVNKGEKRARRRLTVALIALAAVLLALWTVLVLTPQAGSAMLRRLIPSSFASSFVSFERLRWAGLCLLSLLVLALFALAFRFARRWPLVAGAVLLALHAATQLFFLRPLMPTDRVAPYLHPPALLAQVPAAGLTVRGAYGQVMGPSKLSQGPFPSNRAYWLERRAFATLYPMGGPIWRRRFDLAPSPEGLDSFLSQTAVRVMQNARSDGDRLRLLAAWGVDRLIVDAPLSAFVASQVSLVWSGTLIGQPVYVYRVERSAPQVAFAGHLRYSGDIGSTYDRLVAPEFDPRSSAVLAGVGKPSDDGRGTLRLERSTPESLSVIVDSTGSGAVLIQRAYQAFYRAWLDGRRVPIEVANLDRMAVRVPAGHHRLRVATDRRPLGWEAALALLGALVLVVLAEWRGSAPLRGRGRRPGTAKIGADSAGPGDDGKNSS